MLLAGGLATWSPPREKKVGPHAAKKMSSKIRVVIAKPGLDGHDRGAKVIARALRDAGMEVIYTGIRQTPEMIVEAAIQEDVDTILMSILSGAHMAIFPRVMELLKQKGMTDVLVVLGGIVPDEDAAALKRLGVAQLSDGLVGLPADARTSEHLEWIAQEVREAGGQASVWLAEPTDANASSTNTTLACIIPSVYW